MQKMPENNYGGKIYYNCFGQHYCLLFEIFASNF